MTIVSPYRAGSGSPDTALKVTQRAGFVRHRDERDNVTDISPDQRLGVDFGPETDRYASGGPLWVISHTPLSPDDGPRWDATFSDEVPAELIAAFLHAALNPAGLDPDRDPDTDPASDSASGSDDDAPDSDDGAASS